MTVVDLLQHPLASPAWEQLPAVYHRPMARSLWAGPETGEEGAPPDRIVHARTVEFPTGARLHRLGVVVGHGYHKCASGFEHDWATDVRVLVPAASGWRVLAQRRGLPRPADGEPTWIDLGGTTAQSVVVEVRRCAVDGWWPGWNLVMTGLRLEGELGPPPEPAPHRLLELAGLRLDGLPDGVEVRRGTGEVRFRTPFLEVGFRLRSAGLAFLGLDADGSGRTDRNLLQLPRSMDIVRTGVYPAGVFPVMRDALAEYLTQGPRLALADGRRPLALLVTDVEGTTEVAGNEVRYHVHVPSVGQRYELTWRVLRDRLELEAERTGELPLRALRSSAWHLPTDTRVTPTTVLARPLRRGETGLVEAPLLLHAPRHGSLAVTASGPALFRSDAVRPLDTNTFELKLGEEPQREGDYVLRAGSHRADVELLVRTPALGALGPGAPAAVRRMVARHGPTALPYRPDTATYSNNGASMHCTTTLNDLSALSVRLGEPAPGVRPVDLLADSIERWLHGAPAYGSGSTSHGGHQLEDEYVQLGADTLMGVATYLDSAAEPAWLEVHGEALARELERTRARDVDGDGLIESPLRRGISGEHQWSTCFYDVLSFGWKDAFANAVLHPTLLVLARALPRLGRPDLAEGLEEWAERLRAAYLPTFLNPETGWIAGWRSADGVLHDHAFPIVNGAAVAGGAVDPETGREILRRLLAEFTRVGYDDFRLGVPVNLRRVPDEDIGGVVFGLPLGGYLQGGASHHRARHLVDGLYVAGLREEADALLGALAESLADDSAFGGNGTGVDWRMWDGSPSGYEGQLAEGFGILACALDRYPAEPA